MRIFKTLFYHKCAFSTGLYTVTAATTGVAATTATAAGMSTAAAAGRYRTVGARLADELCAWVIDLHLSIQSGHHLSAVCLVGT